MTFLAKSLRAALAVLVVLMFYKPAFGTRRAAMLSIVAALVATTAWFLAGDPFGIDNAYVAVAMPLLVMTSSHLRHRRRRQEPDRPDRPEPVAKREHSS